MVLVVVVKIVACVINYQLISSNLSDTQIQLLGQISIDKDKKVSIFIYTISLYMHANSICANAVCVHLQACNFK